MTSLGPLVALGFTLLESEIYAYLMTDSPVTGYRVAQAISKPVANTYKAIESLAAKGAVLVDDGEARLVRAHPPDELIGRLRREFGARCTAAEAALSQLHRPRDDERIYSLRSREQVLERARAMLAAASVTAVVDAFPGALMELRPALEEAARRGVAVGVTAYADCTLDGVTVVVHDRTELVLACFPGEQLALVTDGREHLMAFFRRGDGQPRQAIWSRSNFLSIQHHDGLVCMMLTQILDRLLAGRLTLEQAQAARESLRRHSIVRTPGLASFVELRTTEIIELARRLYPAMKDAYP